MQIQVNSGSRGTVEAAAQSFAAPAHHSLNGAISHLSAMDKRLALLHKAMGEPIPSPLPCADVPRASLPVPGKPAPAPALASLHRTVLVSAACLLGAAGVLWLLLQSSLSEPLAPPSGSTVKEPVATTTPPATAVVAVVATTVRSDEDDVRALIETWRLAWSRSDVNAYLGHYSAQFVPVKGQAQAQWAAHRRKVISGRSDIQVSTRELRIERIDERSMQVAFLQDYAAGTYRETAQPKILLIQREDSGWRIVSEQTLPVGPAPAP